MLDDRARSLLKTLVERYIADGSRWVRARCRAPSGLDLSPATIRNVMADLEDLGLIASPHTSAGRVPTPRGYRLFVDTMLTARPLDLEHAPPDVAAAARQLHPDQPQRVIAQAAALLSNLSHFVGVVMAPRKASVFHHIEFLRLGERRVLVILVAPDGDVQNRVIFTARDHTQGELLEATNYLNAHYAGLTIEEVRERLKHEVDALRGEIAALMQAAVQAGTEALAESSDNVVVSGERNLLGVQDFGNDMGQPAPAVRPVRAEDRADAPAGRDQPRRRRAHLHRRREPGGAVRGAVGGDRALRGRRPHRRHAGRDRPHAHGLRPHDPDRRHHLAAGRQRAVARSSGGGPALNARCPGGR